MKRSAELKDPPSLDQSEQPVFPDAPDFISAPPPMTLAELMRLNESMLPYWNKQRYAPGSPYLEEVKMEPFIVDK